MTTDLNRRTFLRQAGAGTIALAGASALVGASPAAADEEHEHEHEGIGFFFSALDSAGPVHNRTSPDVLIMQGCGNFDEESGDIRGNGFFVHYDGSSTVFPQPIKATGFWEARQFVSFNRGPAFGVNVTGIMVAEVNLFRQSPEPQAVIPATLRVICNVPAIPFSTGEDEGFQLTVGNLTFQQLTPTMGISGFDDLSLMEAD